ncbi:hypothetical protein GNP61_00255 [Aliivibrio fischeri]|uniref:hypothetical protein n=1 Tax=Aliivibrio fischeri TaxID=668 RepID=UPI0012DA9574|nr:hypothetical protein [Aliivibrio fischeri]MUK39983.1 hypothetical protein [Aliivibrio fischeri]
MKKEYIDFLPTIYMMDFYKKVAKNKNKNKNNIRVDKLARYFDQFKKIFFIKLKLRKIDAIIFNDESDRRLIEGKYISASTDFIEKFYKTITFEMRTGNRISANDTYTKSIISEQSLLFFSKVLRKTCHVFFIRKFNLILNDFYEQKCVVDLSEDEIINKAKDHFYQFYVYKLMLKILSPKEVFINNAYFRYPLIQACNILNIRVVEVQHGMITESHPGYFPSIKYNSSSILDGIFLYSEHTAKLLEKSKTFMKTDKIVVGNYLMDKLPKIYNEKKWPNSFCVSLQYTCDLDLIDRLKLYFDAHPNFYCYLIPRGRGEDFYNDLVLPSNMKFVFDKTIYEMMSYCEYHITSYSTCCYEASAFGCFNILISLPGDFNQHTYFINEALSKSGENYLYLTENCDDEDLINRYVKEEKILIKGYFYKENYLDNLSDYFRG